MKKLLLLGLFGANIYAVNNPITFDPSSAQRFEENNECYNCNLTFYSTKPKMDRQYARIEGSNVTGSKIGSPDENWSWSDFRLVIGSEGTNWSGNFTLASFIDSKIYNGIFNGNFDNAIFENSTIVSSSFKNSHIGIANFSHANLTDTNFDGVNASGTNFGEANLAGTTFVKANLCGANISDSQLEQIKDLSCAVKLDCSGKYPDKEGKPCS